MLVNQGRLRLSSGLCMRAGLVYNPELSRVIPYLLLISVLGVFCLTGLRKLMIIDWRLPFPSGTASAIMLISFHSDVGGGNTQPEVIVVLTKQCLCCRSWITYGVTYSDQACAFAFCYDACRKEKQRP